MDNTFSIAEANALGECLGEFEITSDRMRFLPPLVQFVFALPFAAIGLGLFVGKDIKLENLFFLVMGLLLVCIPGFIIVFSFRQGAWYLRVFKKGMLVTLKGEETQVYWSDIIAISQGELINLRLGEGEGIAFEVFQHYILKMRDGTEHTISGIKVIKVRDLGELIDYYWKRALAESW